MGGVKFGGISMFKIKNNKIFLAMISIFLMVGIVGSNIVVARRAVKRVATVQKQETRDKRLMP